MFEQLRNNDLIITNDKYSILKYLNDNKKLLNLRIMTLNEFKSKYFGTYDEKAIYYLVNKYNYKYNVAKLYLDNFLFNEDLKKELVDNNLIIEEPLFKESIKRIVIINTDIDKYIQDEIDKYDNVVINSLGGNFVHPVYEFDSIEDEVNFVCISILDLLNTWDINNIKLVNVTSEYEQQIIRMFKFYNIPINLNLRKNIYGTFSVKKFLKTLKVTKDISLALEDIIKDDIYNEIVDVCNKYIFKDIDDVIIYLIEEELKKSYIKETEKDNAVGICDIDDITIENYYFILGFNQGVLPKVYKDEDYYSDYKKNELGIMTSLDKSIKEKNKIKDILSTYENMTLSYKLKSYKEDYYKSSLIDEMNLEIKRYNDYKYCYSNIYNKIMLSKKLDRLIKFNEKDENLGLLYFNYKNLPYLTYDNRYKKIDKSLFNDYIKNDLLLSYSSIDNYYRCGFRYYLSNILKLNKYEETFMTYIGNLFHYILSIAFNDNFDFEEEFNKYISDKEFSKKEEFFINKLKNDLLFTIDTIKKQDSYSELTNQLYEEKIFINKDRNIKITFMGIIDKIKYQTFDDKTIVAIIDYKTGLPEIDLDNMFYGISMQLPIYLYLAKNSSLENVSVAGFYLQKIIHNKLNYQENKDYESEVQKLYRLEGYSNSDIDILSKLDKSFNDSCMIKSLKTSSKGFYAYSKVLSDEELNKIYCLVDDKINNAIDEIVDVNFDINPKRIGNDLKGCEYCKFKDICYRKEEDIVNLQSISYKEFLGGDE